MPNVSHGSRRKTRHTLRKKKREKTPITQRLQSFENGEHVRIQIDPSIHDGMSHPRFHGATGDITGEQGDAYVVAVETDRGTKHVIAHPVHLERCQ